MNNPASKGRNGDSMLVHMTPAEVGGLAALAETYGRQLTINPETGYPEAFSLGDILPSIVGIGASAMMPAASPWLVGGLSGLTSYATTGSLEKGLMTGLTAGGLSSLGNSLAAEGAAAGAGGAAQSGTTEAIMSAAPRTAPEGIMGMDKVAQQAIKPGMTNQLAQDISMQAPTQGFFDNVGQRFGDMGRGIASLTESGRWGEFLAANKKPILTAGAGILGNMAYSDQLRRQEELEDARNKRLSDKQRMYTSTVADIRDNYADAGRDFRLGSLSASPNFNRKYYASGGLAESDKNQIYQDIALSYLDAGREVPSHLKKYLPENNKTVSAPAGYNFGHWGNSISIGNLTAPDPTPNNLSPVLGFGGIASRNNGRMYTGLVGLEGRNQDYKPQPFERIQDKPLGPRQMVANTADVIANMASSGGAAAQPSAVMGANQVLADAGMSGQVPSQGAVSANQVLADAGMTMPKIQMASGGEVVGPGDGMSDQIMTTINGNEPAALSDGEFVIPADVVSHLGNGSTDAGAQRLYEMMDRVRKARTGTTKQSKEIDAESLLPA